MQKRTPTIPAPNGSTDSYSEGWNYADWYLSTGGSADSDSPDGWSDEKYEGWWDRLAKEKRLTAPA